MRLRNLRLDPLILWKQEERPVDWEHCFGRKAPLAVEIGFGNGEYLARLARSQPERDYVGIELEWGSVKRALSRIAQAKLTNVRIVQTDAHVAFDWLFKPLSVQHVYSLFPHPWPKKRHAKHRLFSQPFFTLLNNRIIPGGEVGIVTDHSPYAQWIMAHVKDTGFELHTGTVLPSYDTKYERKWHELGVNEFHQLKLIKQTHMEIPFMEEEKVETYVVDDFNPDSFSPASQHGEITIEHKEFLYDPQRAKGMIRTLVAEQRLVQEFWIAIVKTQGGWRICPSRGCGIVPTEGVQRALDSVHEAIV